MSDANEFIELEDEDLFIEEDIDLSVELEDEESSISLMTSIEVDLRAELVDIVNALRNTLATIEAKPKDVTRTLKTLPVGSIHALPQHLYPVVSNILNDLSAPDRYNSMTDGDRVKVIGDLLFNYSRYSPGVHADEFYKDCLHQCQKFNAINVTHYVEPKFNTYVTKDSIEQTLAKIQVAVESFTYIKVILDNPLGNKASVFDLSAYNGSTTPVLESYIKEHGATTCTAKVYRDCIEATVGSQEVLDTIRLDYDRTAGMDASELIRRLVAVEVEDGVFAPYTLKESELDGLLSDTTARVAIRVLDVLGDALARGSLSADILSLIVWYSLIPDLASNKAELSDSARNLMWSLVKMFHCINTKPKLMSIAVYDNVRVGDTYTLGYTLNGELFEVEHPTLLCSILGEGAACVTVPEVLEMANGYLYPPANLIRSLNSEAAKSNVRVSSGVSKFMAEPRIQWLSSVNILALKSGNDLDTSASGDYLGLELSDLVVALNDLEDEFDTSTPMPVTLVVKASAYTIYGLQRAGDAVIQVYCIKDGSTCISYAGTLLKDADLSKVIVDFTRFDGSTETLIFSESEVVLDTVKVSETCDKVDFDLDKVLDMQIPDKLPIELGRAKALEGVCNLYALDYSDIVHKARSVMATSLRNVLRLFEVENIISGHLLSYLSGMDDTQQVLGDNVNQEAILNLLSMYHGERLDKVSLEGRFDGHTVASYATYLDSLDFYILSLQILSHNGVDDATLSLELSALYELPKVRLRLQRLENLMVITYLCFEVGDGLLPLFGSKSKVAKLFKTGVVADNREQSVGILEKQFSNSFLGIPMIDRFHRTEHTNQDSVQKYLILNTDLYGFWQTLGDNQTLKDAILASGVKLELLESGQAIFASEVSIDRQKIIFNAIREYTLPIVTRGIMEEATSLVSPDFFLLFDLVLNYVESSYTPIPFDSSCKKLTEYVGSFYVTFCPVSGETLMEVGRHSRDSLFYKNPQDFICGESLYPLVGYNLSVLMEEDFIE